MKAILNIFFVGAVIVWHTSGVSTEPKSPVPPRSEIDPFQNITALPCTTNDHGTSVRNVIIGESYRWTNFYVHPDPAYNSQEYEAINNAMYYLWQIIPCVSFGIWPQDSVPSGDYVRIVKGTNNGCNSWVGRRGGRQDMNLQSPGCMNRGTIYHELMHALGFHHEHTRYDRDNYINIHWENIEDGQVPNFDTQSTSQFTTFNVPYNLQSIMHYQYTAFSRNGLPTISSRTGEAVGRREELEETDIWKLKQMYNCQRSIEIN